MKRYITGGLFLLLAFFVGRASNPPRAQAQSAAWTVIGGGPVSTCSKPAGVTYLCVGSDDIIASKNGAPPVSLFPGALGPVVTSWNGQTGNVVYAPPAPPVTSVNGKTGAVVISATTSSTTTSNTTLQ